MVQVRNGAASKVALQQLDELYAILQEVTPMKETKDKFKWFRNAEGVYTSTLGYDVCSKILMEAPDAPMNMVDEE